MQVQISNPDHLAARAMVAAWEPPPPVDYQHWATENIVFTERESPFPGAYNPRLFPEFDEILKALSPEDPCRVVTLKKSAQIGGTVLGNIFTLGSLAMDPGDLLYTHPTDDNGQRWSKMKLSPMLKNTASLKGVFPQKARDGADSIMYKERSDGRGAILISGANSPASLSQVSVKRQVQDDLAKWEMNAAGDPEAQADSRSRAYEFAKLFKISTPMIDPGCRISASYEAGSQERPYVPCPHCETLQVLEWPNMLATIEADPDDPHFTCTGCGCEIREHDRRWMKERLEWRAENPKAKAYHRSFWIWSAYSLAQSFLTIAREWLKAKGDAAKERTFLNDTCGLAYRGAGETVPWEQLRDRAAQSDYTVGNIPAGALLVTAGIDCQGDRVEWQVVGWGRDYRRWVIAYGVFPGHISTPECRTKLDGLLAQTWPNSVGRQLGLDGVAIDGNAYTEDVWDWIKKHPTSKVFMVRGVGADTAPLLSRVKKERATRGRKVGETLRYSRRFYNFGTSVLKMGLYRNLAKTDPLGLGYVGLPAGLEDEYFKQLTAERRQQVKRKDGFVSYQWVKDPGQANEGLDTHLQAEAAAIKLGLRSLPDAYWAKLELERETPPPPSAQLDLEDLPLLQRASTDKPSPPTEAPRAPAAAGNPSRPPPRSIVGGLA